MVSVPKSFFLNTMVSKPRNPMTDIKQFEGPVSFEPADLRCKDDIFISVRFMPDGGCPHPYFHLSARITGAIEPNETGVLLIDLWETAAPEKCIASMTFTVSHGLVTIEDGFVRGDHKGYGLMHLLIALAQNLCGWSRGVTGFQYILAD